jgi:hypothetical protein
MTTRSEGHLWIVARIFHRFVIVSYLLISWQVQSLYHEIELLCRVYLPVSTLRPLMSPSRGRGPETPLS